MHISASCASEKRLPKVPVPPIEHTLGRYLEYARVVSGNDNNAIARTEEAVTKFIKVGMDLQNKLEKIAERDDNWVNRYWLPEMYLKVRLPLPIFSSPVYVFPPQKFRNLDEQINYTSWLVRGIMEYKDLIDRKKVEREMSTGLNKVRMCMWQYDRLLRCYREPFSPTDIQHYQVDADMNTDRWNEHVLVMCNNQTFIMYTRVGGELLNQSEIAHQLSEVVRMSENRPGGTVIPIGGGTCGNRDDAAAFWAIMKEVPQNEESLSLVRSAVFTVCIDRISDPIKWRDDSETNSAIRGMHLLHGFGSKRMGLNRWYDTTIHLIVSNDGTNGLLIEHSVAEGIVIINMAEYALRVSAQNANRKITDGVKRLLTPKALSWYVAPAAQTLLLKQTETFDELASELELRVLEFKDFGKEFIKSCSLSPDGFVQLSMQLAYYRLHGRLVSTYESASIRRFFHGRVDNIRAATPEALLWVETMMSRRKSLALKKKLFEEAAKKQALITLENITGFGIDNHLCALNVLAAEQVERGKLPCLPEIFTDPIWTETMRFPLSTSQVTTSWKNTYLCYGPVVRDGYGCSYNIQANSITFAPSALKSCPTTNVDKFRGALVESLRDMKMLVT
uniref:Choline O-acetyltransferase n=1 Tax=Ascaris lumbricoides TaxID=6252 RepID=A0A9J2P8C7_ASCLU